MAGYSQVMGGVSSLAQGSKELVSGSGELYDGTVELYDGVASLCDGAQEMADGTGEFRAETADMDSQIDEEIDSLLDSIGGNMDDPVSFVSKKNTHVDSVQTSSRKRGILPGREADGTISKRLTASLKRTPNSNFNRLRNLSYLGRLAVDNAPSAGYNKDRKGAVANL